MDVWVAHHYLKRLSSDVFSRSHGWVLRSVFVQIFIIKKPGSLSDTGRRQHL